MAIMTNQPLGFLKVNPAQVTTPQGVTPAPVWQATGLGLDDKFSKDFDGDCGYLDGGSAASAVTGLWSKADLAARGLIGKQNAIELAQNAAIRIYSRNDYTGQATTQCLTSGAMIYTFHKIEVMGCLVSGSLTLSVYMEPGIQFAGKPTTYTPYLEENDSSLNNRIESALQKLGALDGRVIAKACKIYDQLGNDTKKLLVITFPTTEHGVGEVWLGDENNLERVNVDQVLETPRPADFIGSIEYVLDGIGGLSIDGTRQVTFTPSNANPMYMVPLV